jgi:lipase ATG15
MYVHVPPVYGLRSRSELDIFQSFPFGWEDPKDGFRGHVFVSSDNSTVILAIKGTILRGPTSKKDKFNDNLLFSCCCARVDITWIFRTVCDCYAKHWRCDDTCLSESLIEESLFYSSGVVSASPHRNTPHQPLIKQQSLVDDLIFLYPDSNIWLVGHSLGGALASLLGATFGLPAVSFESPGEKLAASRLHLPLPPPPHLPAVTHVYHNADPIPQGTCSGMYSPCAQAGYALETRCHLGKSIVFDTVGKLGWRVDVRKHIIREVIEGVLEHDPETRNGDPKWEWEEGREVPLAKEELGCVVSLRGPSQRLTILIAHRIVINGSSYEAKTRTWECIHIIFNICIELRFHEIVRTHETRTHPLCAPAHKPA